MKINLTYLFFLLFLLCSCGEHKHPIESYGDILANGKMETRNRDHPPIPDPRSCFLCHQEYAIHSADRLNDVAVDLVQIQDIVKADGIYSCQKCHGDIK